ncbi:MAG: cysteine desulfurase family protein [Sporichthyaceae bacterium]
MDGYLDAASTEPMHPSARAVYAAALEDGWADPARLYRAGRQARMRLDAAREVVAQVLGAAPAEVLFTSSGTEAVQLGIAGCLKGRARVGSRLVASAVEHSAVLHAAQRHEAAGGDVDLVGVDRSGAVDPAEFLSRLTPDTALACLQSANHEVGTVQPVAAVAAAGEVPLLVDAAQTIGRTPVPEGWSVLCGSAHKWGGPPGVGVLVVRRPARWRSPLPGGAWPAGVVPGYANVPGIAAAAAALAAVAEDAEQESARLAALTERVRAVAASWPDVVVLGDPTHRLPHLVTFSCLYVDGEALVTELDRAGFAVNSGSSCTADTLRPSHVLEAMGVLSHGNVRVSLPRGVEGATVDRFLGTVPRVLADLRRIAGVEGL